MRTFLLRGKNLFLLVEAAEGREPSIVDYRYLLREVGKGKKQLILRRTIQFVKRT